CDGPCHTRRRISRSSTRCTEASPGRPMARCPTTSPGSTPTSARTPTTPNARALLRAAGYGKGFTTTLAYSTAEPLGAPVGAQLQSGFGDVGVTLELEALPPSTYTRALFAGERPMFFQTFGADSPDPAYALGVF